MALNDRRHPDADQFAAYAEGVLEVEARAEIEEHLLDCADCRDIVADTMTFIDANPVASGVPVGTGAARVIPFRSRRWVTGVAVALAAAAALVLAVRVARPDWVSSLFGARGDRPELQELIAAVAKEPTRPVEGRLTGGFAYGPPPAPNRGAGDREVSPDVRIAAAKIEKEAHNTGAPAQVAALGVAYLATGSVDRAVDFLERAVAAAPETADFQSDLAAAYLARAQRNDRPEDWPQALAAAERALRANPRLIEALFNRALALDGLNLREQAKGAWGDVLKQGSGREWSAEAQRRLSRLGEPRSRLQSDDVLRALLLAPAPEAIATVVSADGLLARELIEDQLLPDWGEAWLAGNKHDASQFFGLARMIAAALEAQTQDPIARRAVDAAGNCGALTDVIARAHVEWRRARTAYVRNVPAEFGPLFQDAALGFSACHSPMLLWAQHYGVVRLYFEGDIDQGSEAAAELLSRAESQRSPALSGRIHWDLGSMHYQRARFGEAVREWSLALDFFVAGGERDNIAVMHQSLAESFGHLGNQQESWRSHRKALALSDTVRDIRRRQAVFTGPGYTAINADAPEVAVNFFLEALTAATGWRDPNYLFEAEVGAGRSLARMGRSAEAQVLLDAALSLEPAVTNPNYRTRFAADLRLALAEVAEFEHHADVVVRITDDILTRVASVSSEYRIAYLHLIRGRAFRALSQFETARAEFKQGIEHLESKRALLQQDSQRVSYLDSAWDLYGEMVGLSAIDLSDSDDALLWADRGRARALTEVVTPSRDNAPRNEPSTLDADHAVLFLVVTDRGAFSWLLTRAHGTLFKHGSADLKGMEDLAARLADSQANPVGTKQALTRAYDLIIRPFDDALVGVHHLTIVPDWTSQRLPFAALLDAAQGEYLVQRMSIAIAPSLSTALRRRPRDIRVPESVAIFADPRVPSSAQPLPALPGARAEATRIAALYSRSRIFSGVDATQSALSSALDSFEVIHVATHAVADPRYQDTMALALAGRAGPLSLSAVGAGMSRQKLVVLAACNTSKGPKSRGEVLMNLARPFLAAGATDAVVTLWDVADDSTAEFMGLFHHDVALGVDAAEALANAQRRLLVKTSDRVPWWSGFIVVSAWAGSTKGA